jgi:hypothetical protein
VYLRAIHWINAWNRTKESKSEAVDDHMQISREIEAVLGRSRACLLERQNGT